MKCQEREQYLEAYLDGELDARDRGAVENHLAACELCANAYEALVSEAALYATYERGVEAAAPRLWGGVEARIRAGEAGREVGLLQRVSAWFAPLLTAPRFSPALTAALVLVAVGLTVGVMKLTSSNNYSSEVAVNVPPFDPTRVVHSPATPQPAATSSPAPAETPTIAPSATPAVKPSPEKGKSPVNERRRVNETLKGGAQVQQASNSVPVPQGAQTPEQLVRDAERQYIAAIQLLQRDVARRPSKLDPQTAARFNETLAAIDRSIGETRRAVQQHEGDPVAAQYMLSAYAKKVEVLREMAHLEQGND
ncbi:MAG: zf-HC2 domain-containing protein [Pyrinomonadaceae bacterium]